MSHGNTAALFPVVCARQQSRVSTVIASTGLQKLAKQFAKGIVLWVIFFFFWDLLWISWNLSAFSPRESVKSRAEGLDQRAEICRASADLHWLTGA